MNKFSFKLLLICGLMTSFACQLAHAQLGAAVKNAAKKAAVKNAAKQSALSRANKNATFKSIPGENGPRAKLPVLYKENGQIVKRWSNPLCSKQSKCPLPEHVGKSFKAGTYDERVIQEDTYLYRVYSDPKQQLYTENNAYAYWSRSPTKGTQAIIEKAIPTLKNGNSAENIVKIKVPKGTTIYEGQASKDAKLAGGANQVVLKKEDIEKIKQIPDSVYYY